MPTLDEVFRNEQKKRDILARLKERLDEHLRKEGVMFSETSPTKIYAFRVPIDDLEAYGTNADDFWLDHIVERVSNDVKEKRIVSIVEGARTELGRDIGADKSTYILVVSFLY